MAHAREIRNIETSHRALEHPIAQFVFCNCTILRGNARCDASTLRASRALVHHARAAETARIWHARAWRGQSWTT
eukprot:6999291-Lingulodinium_polyedra.AAC.1